MKSKKKLSFFKKLRVRYKLFILNEGTLEEVYHLRLSALSFFVFFMLFLILVLVLYSTIFWYTPLRKLLPNDDVALRREVLANEMAIDSLMDEVKLREDYLTTIMMVMNGAEPIDSTWTADSVYTLHKQEPLMEKSLKEAEFCKQFEEDERFNLANTTSNVPDLVFLPPVKGTVVKSFNRKENHLGIDLYAASGTPVLAVYQGVVMATGYAPQDGYYLIVAHKQNYVSVYSGASELLKRQGDVVKTGEVLARTGDEYKDHPSELHFELWNGMQALDPTMYIVME